MTAPPPPPVQPPGTRWRWKTGLFSLAVVVVIVTGVFAFRSVGRTSRDIDTAKVGDCVEPDWPHNTATWHVAECTGSGDHLVIGRIDSQMRPADDATLQQLCRAFSPFAGGFWVGPSVGPGFVLCFETTGK
jgi:hypothetical protein